MRVVNPRYLVPRIVIGFVDDDQILDAVDTPAQLLSLLEHCSPTVTRASDLTYKVL